MLKTNIAIINPIIEPKKLALMTFDQFYKFIKHLFRQFTNTSTLFTFLIGAVTLVINTFTSLTLTPVQFSTCSFTFNCSSSVVFGILISGITSPFKINKNLTF